MPEKNSKNGVYGMVFIQCCVINYRDNFYVLVFYTVI